MRGGLRSQASQRALPGGQVDDGETTEQAALREIAEVGLTLEPSAILGRLDNYATCSGYVITPVAVWTGPAAGVTVNAAEVASIHCPPTSEQLRANAPLLNQFRGAPHPMLRMPIGEAPIAAPTAIWLGPAPQAAFFDQPVFG